LIVDDALFIRSIVRRMLEAAGHEVIGEGENGQEAVDLYRQLRPDVVVLDLTMAVLDGISALGEIRSEDPTARVIMCSSIGQERRVQQAHALGAVAYLSKPVDPEALCAAVAQAVAG
jgi:two-component system chemotaxis response regulator CheY